jgi:hypothetical protein
MCEDAGFIPAFCTNCGATVNDVDLEEDDGSTFSVPADVLSYFEHQADLGSPYRCGWCGITTNDYSHIGRCKKLGMGGSATRMARHSVRLRALIADLEAMAEV